MIGAPRLLLDDRLFDDFLLAPSERRSGGACDISRQV
jgi:hypothetical protein